MLEITQNSSSSNSSSSRRTVILFLCPSAHIWTPRSDPCAVMQAVSWRVLRPPCVCLCCCYVRQPSVPPVVLTARFWLSRSRWDPAYLLPHVLLLRRCGGVAAWRRGGAHLHVRCVWGRMDVLPARWHWPSFCVITEQHTLSLSHGRNTDFNSRSHLTQTGFTPSDWT